jgi:hypothetical protein
MLLLSKLIKIYFFYNLVPCNTTENSISLTRQDSIILIQQKFKHIFTNQAKLQNGSVYGQIIIAITYIPLWVKFGIFQKFIRIVKQYFTAAVTGKFDKLRFSLHKSNSPYYSSPYCYY